MVRARNDCILQILQKLWLPHNKIKEKINRDNDNNSENINLVPVNQMIDKTTNNLEGFNYNVIVANIYETYNFLNKIIDREINSTILKECYKKMLILFSPAIPHFSAECLDDLSFLKKIEWPKIDKSLLVEEKIDYVIQINGKKRAILNENRDIDQESLMNRIKLNKLSEKYLKDKSIRKIIFVKNRLINLLTNE